MTVDESVLLSLAEATADAGRDRPVRRYGKRIQRDCIAS
jgi:hypothetical protein